MSVLILLRIRTKWLGPNENSRDMPWRKEGVKSFVCILFILFYEFRTLSHDDLLRAWSGEKRRRNITIFPGGISISRQAILCIFFPVCVFTHCITYQESKLNHGPILAHKVWLFCVVYNRSQIYFVNELDSKSSHILLCKMYKNITMQL